MPGMEKPGECRTEINLIPRVHSRLASCADNALLLVSREKLTHRTLKPKHIQIREIISRLLRKPVLMNFWIKPRTDGIGAEFGSRVKVVIHRDVEFRLSHVVPFPRKEIHHFIYGLEFGWRYLQITADDHALSRSYESLIVAAMSEFKCGSSPDAIVIRKPEPSDTSKDMACVYYLTEAQMACIEARHSMEHRAE